MKLFPKSWLWRIVLSLFLLAFVAAVTGSMYLRNMILTGGLNQSDRPEIDGLAATGETVMVVGTTGGRAQKIGVEVLQNGGNAMDAALATSLAQIALAGGSWVSYAGIAALLYYDAASGEVSNMNGGFNTVLAESTYEGVPGLDLLALVKRDAEREGHHNGRTVLVPGYMRGIEAAHRRFGRLPFADIFTPTIALAEEGFEVNAGLASQFVFRKKILSKFPETRKHFVKADGAFYAEGDLFKQPYLAQTLRRVAADGADYMYTGTWAEKFVTAVQSIGGRITLEDLANYEATWHDPLVTTHNGYEVYAHGLPSYGGVNLIEALNLIEAADLANKPHYSESAESFFWLSHITRAANASRDISGDAAATNSASLIGRLTKKHAAELWRAMQENGGFDVGIIDMDTDMDAGPKHSDGVVVIDAEGNMVALLHTINTVSFGETGLVVDGVSIPDALTNQLDVAKVTEPGARLPDPGAPVIVLKDGQPYGAFSTIGAGLHPRLVNVLYGVLDFGMTPGEALDQPAFGLSLNFSGFWASLWGSYQTLSAGELDPGVEEQVKDMGLVIIYNKLYSGYVVGATIDPETGVRHGGTIKHFGGRPVGY